MAIPLLILTQYVNPFFFSVHCFISKNMNEHVVHILPLTLEILYHPAATYLKIESWLSKIAEHSVDWMR